ncbi:MAG: hypothetical protein GF308_03450 [Candidatus Heimdallarchaeota archaeon]|nr:hypothetical protein [Candidatus Heimdallarchaeota archaeon]
MQAKQPQKIEIIQLIKDYASVHCKNRTAKEQELLNYYQGLRKSEHKKLFWSELLDYLYSSATDYEQSIIKQLIQTMRKNISDKRFYELIVSIKTPSIKRLLPKIKKDFFPKPKLEKTYSKENDSLYQNKLAYSLYQKDSFEEALQICNNLLKRDPKDLDILKLKVKILEKLDKRIHAKKTEQYIKQLMRFDDRYIKSLADSKQTTLDKYFD